MAVTVTCTVNLADLTGLRLPSSETISSQATSVIDTYQADIVSATLDVAAWTAAATPSQGW